jgi:hypothetical protein
LQHSDFALQLIQQRRLLRILQLARLIVAAVGRQVSGGGCQPAGGSIGGKLSVLSCRCRLETGER